MNLGKEIRYQTLNKKKITYMSKGLWHLVLQKRPSN